MSVSPEQKINISDIILNTDKWVTSMEGMTRNRQDSIRYNVSNVLRNKTCICTPLKGSIPSGCYPIEILNRLGTPSMDGEVYLVEIDNVKIAAKIMPIQNYKSVQKNNNEISIATYLSEAVKKGISPFFPIVYGSAQCENTIFSTTSKFKEQTEKHALIDYIRVRLKSKQKRFVALTKASGQLDTIEKIKLFASENGIDIPNNIPVTAYVMLSELAWGDIGDFFKKYGNKINHEIWDKLLLQMLYAVNDLHKLGVYHGDLHIHNLLIMFKQEKDKIETLTLIHDFGKSQKLKELTTQDRKHDLELMISGLIEKSDYYNVPNKILGKLVKMKEIIDSFNKTTPLASILIKFWSKSE